MLDKVPAFQTTFVQTVETSTVPPIPEKTSTVPPSPKHASTNQPVPEKAASTEQFSMTSTDQSDNARSCLMMSAYRPLAPNPGSVSPSSSVPLPSKASLPPSRERTPPPSHAPPVVVTPSSHHSLDNFGRAADKPFEMALAGINPPGLEESLNGATAWYNRPRLFIKKRKGSRRCFKTKDANAQLPSKSFRCDGCKSFHPRRGSCAGKGCL